MWEVKRCQICRCCRCPQSSLRLPDMEERDASRESLCAGCQRGPHDRSHGCCDVAGILSREGNIHKKRQNLARHVCLVTPLSCSSKETEENRKRDVGQARVESET